MLLLCIYIFIYITLQSYQYYHAQNRNKSFIYCLYLRLLQVRIEIYNATLHLAKGIVGRLTEHSYFNPRYICKFKNKNKCYKIPIHCLFIITFTSREWICRNGNIRMWKKYFHLTIKASRVKGSCLERGQPSPSEGDWGNISSPGGLESRSLAISVLEINLKLSDILFNQGWISWHFTF